jgi:hypothetical protein
MQKDLAEQLHNQYILSKRLDVMFDSLSSELVKIRWGPLSLSLPFQDVAQAALPTLAIIGARMHI